MGRTGLRRRTGQVRRPCMGPGGNCVCPAFGQKSPHDIGMPCVEMKCLQYGIPMARE